MSQKQLETRARTKMSKDPLLGAPGHMPSELIDAADAADSEQMATAPESEGGIGEVFTQLTGLFGEENMAKIRTLLSSASEDAEEKIMHLVQNLTARLPKEFKMPTMNTIKKHPVESAAAVAAGVGTVFLLREYFKRDIKAAPKKTAARKPEVKAKAVKSAARSASAVATTKKSATSKKRATGTAAKKAKGAKSRTKSKKSSR